MSDKPRPPRRPLGERDDSEKGQPFGARSRPPGGTPPTAPYPPRQPLAPSAPDPDTSQPSQPASAPLFGEDDDPSRLSWDELLDGVSGEQASPKLLDEDAVFSGSVSAPGGSLLDQPLPAPTPSLPLDAPAGKPSLLKRAARRGRIPAQSYRDEQQEVARPRTALRIDVALRSAGAVTLIGLLAATLFTWWTPSSFLPPRILSQLAVAQATQGGPLAAPTIDPSNAIGIVSGHRGLHPTTGLPDPGAICPDGLTEQQVNESIALQTAALLRADGYHVDIFDEFDARLTGFRALVMVSIHADSCDFINDVATGFKVAGFASSGTPQASQRLVQCLINRYAVATGLPLHPSVTYDMTDYHNFREIDPRTPGAIIEVGFLNLDREFLTEHSDLAARGIVDGLMCFITGEQPAAPGATALPTRTP